MRHQVGGLHMKSEHFPLLLSQPVRSSANGEVWSLLLIISGDNAISPGLHRGLVGKGLGGPVSHFHYCPWMVTSPAEASVSSCGKWAPLYLPHRASVRARKGYGMFSGLPVFCNVREKVKFRAMR